MGTFWYHNMKEYKIPYGTEFVTSDIVKMILNCKQKSLRYFINDKDQGIAHDALDFSQSYTMVISGLYAVQLIDFNMSYVNHDTSE